MNRVPIPPGSAALTMPADAVLTRQLIRTALASHLAGQLPDVPVFRSRMVAIQPDELLPLVLIYAPSERKTFDSRVGGDFWFRPNASIVVQAILDAVDEAAAEAAMDAIALRLEEAILRGANAWMDIGWTPGDVAVDTRIRMEGDRPIGEVTMTFEVQFDENYAPIIPDRLATMGLRIDTIDPADLTGTYPNQPGPPPRLRGPDGRVEIGATIILPSA